MQARTSGGRDFQDRVLGRLQETGQIATIYLRNRMSVRGRVLEFDPYVLLLEPIEGGPAHLVYKSAMVSVSGPRRTGPPRGEGHSRPHHDARGPRPSYPGSENGSAPPEAAAPPPAADLNDAE